MSVSSSFSSPFGCGSRAHESEKEREREPAAARAHARIVRANNRRTNVVYDDNKLFGTDSARAEDGPFVLSLAFRLPASDLSVIRAAIYIQGPVLRLVDARVNYVGQVPRV